MLAWLFLVVSVRSITNAKALKILCGLIKQPKNTTVLSMIETSESFATLSEWGVLKYRVELLSNDLAAKSKREIYSLSEFLRQPELSTQDLAAKLNLDKPASEMYSPHRINSLCHSALEISRHPGATEEDSVLLAIAFWQYTNLGKTRKASELISKAIFRVLKSLCGDAPVKIDRVLQGGQIANCFDSSTLTLNLAEQFGIKGEIKRYPIPKSKNLHYFFQAESGRIIDINLGSLRSGFFFDEADHFANQETKRNRKT